MTGYLTFLSVTNFSLFPPERHFKTDLLIKRALEVMIASQLLPALILGKSMSFIRPGFLVLDTNGISGRIIPPRGVPKHCRMSSSISGLSAQCVHPGLGAISLFVPQLPNVQSVDHKSPISQRHCEDPVSWKGPQTVLGGVY